ncbi:methyl-CpG-binding domain-containing protein 8-like [Carica papaya]|uniref:methyl-CpG-binding domain-containing protein 8-like n=1 Tax=Carica papaya TaxID=3649 RepID=UPI000B8D1881|nr:methyl-CpG-binding domain-containing protein 8-like [Carica papaya]
MGSAAPVDGPHQQNRNQKEAERQGNGHLFLESLPVIDIRFLSQSELLALSLCSSASLSRSLPDDDDVIIPKIDRSVFNESAGSRKQTFSRLRLATRHNHHNENNHSIHKPSVVSQSLERENSQILSLLKSLFPLPEDDGTDSGQVMVEKGKEAEEDGQLFPVRVEYSDPDGNSSSAFQSIPVDVVNSVQRKRKRGRPRKEEKLGGRVTWNGGCEVMAESKVVGGDSIGVSEQTVMENRVGMEVDSVARNA